MTIDNLGECLDNISILICSLSEVLTHFSTIGSIYHLNGDFDLAMKYYNEAWDIKKDTLGTSHADTVMMYGQIGRLLHDQGINLQKSLELLGK